MVSSTPMREHSPQPAPPTILVIEDDVAIGETVQYALERNGYRAVLAGDGLSGIDYFRKHSPDLIILDLLLPLVSGLEVCRMIRAESTVHVIMLTARDSEADRVVGLEVGADDYLTKPFSINELLARVRAQLRRANMMSAPPEEDVLRSGAVILNVTRHELRVRGDEVELTPKEFELLKTLMLGRGRLLSRSLLISEVWGPNYFGDTKTLDVHVKRLRQKIETRPHEPEMIVTVHGLGYRFLDARLYPPFVPAVSMDQGAGQLRIVE